MLNFTTSPPKFHRERSASRLHASDDQQLVVGPTSSRQIEPHL